MKKTRAEALDLEGAKPRDESNARERTDDGDADIDQSGYQSDHFLSLVNNATG